VLWQNRIAIITSMVLGGVDLEEGLSRTKTDSNLPQIKIDVKYFYQTTFFLEF
jgi:hypothetical protein